jgi:transcriptional regulator with XRE-family HTH domain
MEEGNNNSDLCILFGLRLAVIRKLRGLSQERFAAESGLARSHVSGIERGKINVSLSTIGTIAKTLSVEPKELLDFNSLTINHLDDQAKNN